MNTRTLPTVRNLFLSLFVLPILALLAEPALAAEPLPAPDLTGVWTGKITGKRYSQETDQKPTSVKYVVEAAITQIGSDVSIEATLTAPGGGETTYSLQGKTGNRNFWAYNGDSNEPILLLGKVAGKLPKLSISGKGTLVDDVGGFSEVKLSLKRSKTGVLGTAAAGAPVTGAIVTLKDRNGVAVSTSTDSEGRYSLNVLGLTPPFLVKVDPDSGPDIYGIASVAGVANVTPLTDLILKTWYEVQELDLATSFTALGPTTPVPSAIEIALLESLVRRTIQKWLQDNGIDTGSFNLLNSPFDADGTGIDAVLDDTTVAPDGSTLTITDGTTTQTSDVDAASVSGTVTIDTTSTSPGGTTMFTDGTALPGTDSMQAAVAGALATMEALRTKVNTRGAALTAADLLGYSTQDLLNDGDNRSMWAAQSATDMRGASLPSFTLKAIRFYDPESETLGLDLEIHASGGGPGGPPTGVEVLSEDFKKVGSAWLIHGNRRIGDIDVKVEHRTDYFPGSIDGPRKSVNVDVRAPKNTIASVKISGGVVFSDTDCPKDSHTEIMTLEPTPGTEIEYQRDAFFAGANFEVYPVPGTPFTVTVTPVAGTPQVYTILSGGTTTETISLSQPTGNSLANDATPGEAWNAAWTLPNTFAITRFQFNGNAFSADFSCEAPPGVEPQIGDTGGTITFPTTCGGQTISNANFNLSFEGPNGERIMVIWEFNDF